MHLGELALLRRAAYTLFSWMLVYPDHSRLDLVGKAGAELIANVSDVAKFGFSPQWKTFLDCVTNLPGVNLLEKRYVQVFMVGCGAAPCLPYESAYSGDANSAALKIVELDQAYAVSGLVLPPASHDLPDHVAVELEYMAHLCGQEAEAWQKQDLTEGLVLLDRGGAFLSNHLALWVPAWSRAVCQVDQGGIYSTVVGSADAFIIHDLDLTRILLERFPERGQVASQVSARGVAGGQTSCPRSCHCD